MGFQIFQRYHGEREKKGRGENKHRFVPEREKREKGGVRPAAFFSRCGGRKKGRRGVATMGLSGPRLRTGGKKREKGEGRMWAKGACLVFLVSLSGGGKKKKRGGEVLRPVESIMHMVRKRKGKKEGEKSLSTTTNRILLPLGRKREKKICELFLLSLVQKRKKGKGARNNHCPQPDQPQEEKREGDARMNSWGGEEEKKKRKKKKTLTS